VEPADEALVKSVVFAILKQEVAAIYGSRKMIQMPQYALVSFPHCLLPNVGELTTELRRQQSGLHPEDETVSLSKSRD
jgi:hypothetical protein